MIQLQLNKTYRCRKGKIVDIKEHVPENAPTPFRGKYRHTNVYQWWHENGSLRNLPGVEDGLDLIEEITPEVPAEANGVAA